ncbi:MAG: sensor histidine kinase [Lachnospiraceae bacterium]|nr:sensor histidine kinase [Lachnospiraceae bacterium]
MKKHAKLLKSKIKVFGIQTTLMAALTIITVLISLSLGLLLYARFSSSIRNNMLDAGSDLTKTVCRNIEDYLYEMRQVSDTTYYNIIQDIDIGDAAFPQEIGILYEANKDKIITIALYDEFGSLILAEPVASQKEDPNVTRQGWFMEAMGRIENMHFSTPHVQNLFDDTSYRYHKVISLSRFVDLSFGGKPGTGVLLVDMDYGTLSAILEDINETEDGRYYYLCDKEGNIIYHPHNVEITRGLYHENSGMTAGLSDGIYEDKVDGKKRTFIVNTVSYTGWKLVGVIPEKSFSIGTAKVRYFIFAIGTFLIMMLLIVNRVTAIRISKPILSLNDSVMEYEAGEKPEIYVGGSTEIRHLGLSIQKSYEQIDELMKEIVTQQNRRRKAEIAVLQSQINPHFLYNTLESITWMVEGGKNAEASNMISELSKLLRISLSKGRTIISMADELQHSKSYMAIQKVRYKNRFSVEYDIDPEIMDYCTVKLILQPILENAIYYGVGDMEEDEENPGVIKITGKKEEDEIVITIEDNGCGMPKEVLDNLFNEEEKIDTGKHGNGVGIINVDSRIRLLLGSEYGLSVWSEPDEGTIVTVKLPAIPYNEENRKRLEQDSKGTAEGRNL